MEEVGVVADQRPSPVLEKYEHHGHTQVLQKGRTVISIDPRYFRPTEVDTLLGDPSKAKEKLGWQPEISFEQMVEEMVDHDVQDAMRDAISNKSGFTIPDSFEANM